MHRSADDPGTPPTMGVGWRCALAGLVALGLVGCATTGGDAPSQDAAVELPATGTDDARELVEERSGLELPDDAEVEILAWYAATDGIAARFDAPPTQAQALCEPLGDWQVLAEISDTQREWTGVTDDPPFQRICRAADPTSPRRQLEVLHLADRDDPEVVTVYVHAWIMPAR